MKRSNIDEESKMRHGRVYNRLVTDAQRRHISTRGHPLAPHHLSSRLQDAVEADYSTATFPGVMDVAVRLFLRIFSRPLGTH